MWRKQVACGSRALPGARPKGAFGVVFSGGLFAIVCGKCGSEGGGDTIGLTSWSVTTLTGSIVNMESYDKRRLF